MLTAEVKMKIIPKRYCNDFETSVEQVEIKVIGNRIEHEDMGFNFYKIYLWQQQLVNDLLKTNAVVHLQTTYVDNDYIKLLKIESKFDIPEERMVSAQCKACAKRVKCETFQKAMVADFVMDAIESNDKLYTTYNALTARIEALDSIKGTLRKQIDAAIEHAKEGKLILGKLGLTLSIKQFEKDSMEFGYAKENDLLDDKTCSIKIGNMKKKIKGTEHADKLKKVPWQKRLNIE